MPSSSEQKSQETDPTPRSSTAKQRTLRSGSYASSSNRKDSFEGGDVVTYHAKNEHLRSQLAEAGKVLSGLSLRTQQQTQTRFESEEYKVRRKELLKDIQTLQVAVDAETSARVAAAKTFSEYVERKSHEVTELMRETLVPTLQEIEDDVEKISARGKILFSDIETWKEDLPSRLKKETDLFLMELRHVQNQLKVLGETKESIIDTAIPTITKFEEETQKVLEEESQKRDDDFGSLLTQLKRYAEGKLIDDTEENGTSQSGDFRCFAEESLSSLKHHLGNVSRNREEGDDEILNALSHYSEKLHDAAREIAAPRAL